MDNIKISPSARISTTAIIGKAYRPLMGGTGFKYLPTIISDDVYIGDFAIIGRGAKIGEGTILDDYTKIETNVSIGAKCLIQYRTYICSQSKIGEESIIGGFITERTVIGSNCRIFGNIIHRHSDIGLPWDDDEAIEQSPLINDNVFVGFGAQVIGSITIGENSYIAAGAIVTKDVPPHARVFGVNKWE